MKPRDLHEDVVDALDELGLALLERERAKQRFYIANASVDLIGTTPAIRDAAVRVDKARVALDLALLEHS